MTYTDTFPSNNYEAGPPISSAQHRRLEARIREFGLEREQVKLWCALAFGLYHFPLLDLRQYGQLDKLLPTFVSVQRGDEAAPRERYQRLARLIGKFYGGAYPVELDKALSVTLDLFRGWPEPGKPHQTFFRHLLCTFENRLHVKCARCGAVSKPFSSRAGWTRQAMGQPGFPGWICNLCGAAERGKPARQPPLELEAEAPRPAEEPGPERGTPEEPPPAHDDPDFAAEVRARQRRGWLSGPAAATRRAAEKAWETRNRPFRARREPPHDRCSVCGRERPGDHAGWVFLHRLVDVEVGLAAGARPMLTQVRFWICPFCWNAGNLPFSVTAEGDRYAPEILPALDRVAKDMDYIADRYAEPAFGAMLRAAGEGLKAMASPAIPREVGAGRVPSANAAPPAGSDRPPAPSVRPAPSARPLPPGGTARPRETGRERLRRLRAERGLTAAALGERTGLNPTCITKIETGVSKRPRPATVARIAEALGVSPAAISPDGDEP
jgi:DNA-binding XRE family transcriptional regulator